MKRLKSKKVYLFVLTLLLMVSFFDRMGARGELHISISNPPKSETEKSSNQKNTYNEKNTIANTSHGNCSPHLRAVGAQIKTRF